MRGVKIRRRDNQVMLILKQGQAYRSKLWQLLYRLRSTPVHALHLAGSRCPWFSAISRDLYGRDAAIKIQENKTI